MAAAAAAAAGPALPGLPLEILEAVCAPLDLQSRLALTSCCRALWQREDVLASPRLWGDANLGEPCSSSWAAMAQCLAGWLGRRRAALRRLRLLCDAQSGTAVDLGVLLEALGQPPGCGAVELQLRSCGRRGLGEANEAALEGLQRLPALTQLHFEAGTYLRRLPRALSALPALAELRVPESPALGDAGSDALRPLGCAPSLTLLDLSSSNLAAVPGELTALTRLAHLDLKGNSSLGVGGHAAFAPLQVATRLTYLGLALCGLTSVPQQLRSMASLAQLKLSWNEQLGQSQQQAVQVQLPQQQQHGAPDGAGGGDVQDPFEPLLHLTSVTLLEMKCCALVRIPQHVSSLTGLQALELSRNEIGSGGSSAVEPLRHLHRLTKLELGCCGLLAVPPQLAAMPALANLGLYWNPAIGERGVAALEPLAHLRCLSRLDLRRCALLAVPPQLAAASDTLASLDLGTNWRLGHGGEAALSILRTLTALLVLDLSRCGLEAVPAEVAGLGSLRELLLCNNEGMRQGEQRTFEPLSALTGLTRLDMRCCNLVQRVPAELGALSGLRELVLSGNDGLGQGAGGVAFEPLLHLRALTHLNVTQCGLEAGLTDADLRVLSERGCRVFTSNYWE